MALLGTWAKRIAITIDHTKVDADLVDFPVCIHLAAAAGISSDDVSAVFDELTSDANRKKIAVTTSDGSSECYVEIEKWDTTNEQAVLHVKVPSVSSSADTTLYIYYDSAQAENTSYVGDTGDAVSQNVWDSYYSFVLHMIRQSDGSIKDSSVNALDWTSNGMDASNNGNDSTTGKSYLTFDGTEYLTGSNSSLISPGGGAFHNEMLFNTGHDYSSQGGYVFQDVGADQDNIVSVSVSANTGYHNKIKYFIADVSNNFLQRYSDYTTNDGVNHYATISRNGVNNLDTSLDGTQYTTVTGTCGTITLSDGNSPQIGRTSYNYTLYFYGKILEVRFSKGTGRSSSWNKATYNTLFDTLLTFAAEEICGATFLALEDAKLTLSAYYQDLDDLLLSLESYGYSREDLETYFSATDGIVLEDFMSHLEAADYSIEDLKLLLSAYFQDSFDMKTFLSIWGWFRSDFKLYLYAEKIDYKDLLLALYVSKRNLSNLKTYLQAVDGVNVDVMLKLYLRAVSPVVTDSNLKVFLSVTKKIPLRIGSIYHRLTSVTTTIS